MGLYTKTVAYVYARQRMTRVLSDGPWGAAIRYWLDRKGWTQTDLRKESGVKKNTVSKATRGFDVNTSTLRQIAAGLKVSISDVLVSPTRRLAAEETRRMAIEAAEYVLNERRVSETPTPGQPDVTESIDQVKRVIRKAEHAVRKQTPRKKPVQTRN